MAEPSMIGCGAVVGDGARGSRGGGEAAFAPRRRGGRAGLGAAACLALALPGPSRGAAYDVQARTEAEAYAVAAWSPDSGRALERRRLVQSLDLAGFEIVPGEDAGLSLRVRFDADFAVNDRELAGLDGAWRDRLQLLGGSVHWNGLGGGRLDLEAGRITAADALGFWRLDGARAAVRPVPWLSLAAFGGLRVTETSWLGAPAFAPDGTRASDRRRIAAGVPLLPCPGEPTRLCADETLDAAAPTFGARLSLAPSPGAAGSAEVEYRRTLRAGAVIEERLGAGARWRAGALGADAAGEYDLYLRRAAALQAGLRWSALPGLSLSAEGFHSHPTFSADSIWSFFDTAPSREARLRADLAPAGWPARLWAAAGTRWIGATGHGRAAYGDRGGWEPSGAAGGWARLRGTEVQADASIRGGAEGTQAWLGAVVRRTFLSWVGLEARATLARIQDRVAPKNGGVFPALALVLSGRLERNARISLLLEDSAPRWERSDLRLFALVALGAGWDTRMVR
jgi:hypothetical protein